MKSTVFVLSVFLFCSCTSEKSIVTVPPGQSIEMDFGNMDSYQATIKNKSFRGVDIAVVSKKNGEQFRGFGIGSKSKQRIMVEKEGKLLFQNRGEKAVSLAVSAEEKSFPKQPEGIVYKNFTLRNNTAKSIPLIIPTVMNPNLSPFSNSGVSLKIGQEILFREKGKNYVLLTVSNDIMDGEKVDVAKLLKERKKELGI